MTRLLDMGVEDYLLTSTVNGVLAQRLVRRLCPHCRPPYTRVARARRAHRAWRASTGRRRIDALSRRAAARPARGTGYRGRTMILELLPMTDAIRPLVLRHAEAREHPGRAAIAEGMQTMYAHGMRKALAGITTRRGSAARDPRRLTACRALPTRALSRGGRGRRR